MKTKLAALVAAAVLTGAPLALARQGTPDGAPTNITANPAALSPAQRTALLKELSASMEDVKTASGRFEQFSPDFTTTSGTFALSRPGKVRFDYDDPSPLLIVSNGTTVTMQIPNWKRRTACRSAPPRWPCCWTTSSISQPRQRSSMSARKAAMPK